MYKVVLRMVLEWVRITIWLPVLILCFLVWGLLALIWKIAGFGTIKNYCKETDVKSVTDIINARMDYVKTGTYKGWGQQ